MWGIHAMLHIYNRDNVRLFYELTLCNTFALNKLIIINSAKNHVVFSNRKIMPFFRLKNAVFSTEKCRYFV